MTDKAMPCTDKSEARDALQISQEYAKGGIRFFPKLITSDEELAELALENMQRLVNATKPT